MLTVHDDLACVDGLEAVTVIPARGGPGVVAPHALRRRVRQGEAAPSDGVYTEHDAKWYLSTVDVATRPQPGATIVDESGNAWTILEVWPDALNAAWRCRARNLALAENLHDRVTILRPAWRASPRGAAAAQWVVAESDVPARIQPLDDAPVTDLRDDAARPTHAVYLQTTVTLDGAFRIVAGESTYRVVSYRAAERLDQLPVAHVHRV